MQNDHIYGLLMNHKKHLLFYSKKDLKEANIKFVFAYLEGIFNT